MHGILEVLKIKFDKNLKDSSDPYNQPRAHIRNPSSHDEDHQIQEEQPEHLNYIDLRLSQEEEEEEDGEDDQEDEDQDIEDREEPVQGIGNGIDSLDDSGGNHHFLRSTRNFRSPPRHIPRRNHMR